MPTTSHASLWFAAGAVCGALLIAGWFFLGDTPFLAGEETGTTKSKATGGLAADESGRIKVSDQPPGETVLVTEVTASAPGVWVAVREVSGGNLGNVLGAARARSSVANLTVPLLRATVPARQYAVVLYRDDGDDSFDLATDSVYVDFETGEAVVAPFLTTL